MQAILENVEQAKGNEAIIMIIAAVTMAIAIFVLIKTKNKEIAKKIVYALVVSAEQRYGGGTGSLKYMTVIAGLPWYIRILFGEEQISEWIEDGVQWLKKYLKNPDTNLLTYEQELYCENSTEKQ